MCVCMYVCIDCNYDYKADLVVEIFFFFYYPAAGPSRTALYGPGTPGESIQTMAPFQPQANNQATEPNVSADTNLAVGGIIGVTILGRYFSSY